MALGDAKPHPKAVQLARGERRYTRKVAGAKRWQQIADAKQGPCRCCGVPPPNQLHHLVPRAQGGADTEANLVPLCMRCHALVEARDPKACAALRTNLLPGRAPGELGDEESYAVAKKGEGWFEQRYPVGIGN